MLWNLSFPLNGLPPLGLRARMASLRQGCGDLRGLVSTFTQSCQGSLSEAQGQVRNFPLLVPSLWGASVIVSPFLSLRSCLY